MKNILILTTVSGFLNKFERGNVDILHKMGYTVHYAANMREQHYLFEEEEIKKLGVHLHHIDIARSPYMLRYNARAVAQLKRIIIQYDICAIHCHTPVGGTIGRIMGILFRKKKLRIIYTAHGFHFYKGAPFINNTLYYLVEKMLAPYTDILVVINKEDYKNAKKFRLKKGGHVYRIPGVGLDTNCFSPLSDGEKKRRRKILGLEERDCFFVSVGELNENKNQEIILDALAGLREKGADIRHLKYGICGDGFYRERIRLKIQELDLEQNVTMYGYCSHVPEILGCADFSVFPSHREGLGMAGLEALSMGIPLLASENRGTREYLQHGNNGYFCDSKSVQSWMEGIRLMWEMPSEMRENMAYSCRRSAAAFSRECSDSIMELVYQDLEKRISCS